MKYHILGQSDLNVSIICLGSMTWGAQNSETEGHAHLDCGFDHGVNFIDTAELYSIPPTAETQGSSERVIGSWMRARANRDKVIVATKAVGRSDDTYFRGEQSRFHARHLNAAVDNSLDNLGTDYIDLYQLHWPERSTNYFGKLGYEHVEEEDAIEILETLEALGGLVKSGKVRHIGLSNETPWGAMRFLHLAEMHNLPRPVSVQNPYNLLNRSYEVGLAEISIREKCGLMAYSPLASGVLTGKYMNGARPEGARLTLFDRFGRYDTELGHNLTAQYVALAKEHSLDPAQMALAFINNQPFLTSNIIGATTMAQLKINIASADITLSAEVLEGINAIHDQHPYPCP